MFDYAVDNCYVVAPLRNPIANAVSCIARKHSNLVYTARNWEIMAEMAPRYNIFWVDIDATNETRKNMMSQLCDYLQRQPSKPAASDAFIERWKKVNAVPKSNPVKKEYEATKKLPRGYDYRHLDNAIRWYDKLKAELDIKYTPAVGHGTVASNHSKEGSNPSGGTT